MDEKKRKKTERGITIASMILVACVMGYFLYTMIVRKEVGKEYYAVIITFLSLFWILTDVLSITLTKGFEGKTEEQIKAYKIYALMDLVGLGGLAYFVMALENNGMMGAVIYAVAIMGKRKFHDRYRGISEDGEKQEEAEQIEADQAEAGIDQAEADQTKED